MAILKNKKITVVSLKIIANSRGSPPTLCPLVIAVAIPIQTVIMDKVTTRGTILKYATAVPLIKPRNAPTKINKIVPINILFDLAIKLALKTADVAMIAGSEISIPPEIITKVIPKVMIPIGAT
jgi:hypothetical protein